MLQPTNHNKPMRLSGYLLLATITAATAAPSLLLAAPFGNESNPMARTNINPVNTPQPLLPKKNVDGPSPPPPALEELQNQSKGEEAKADDMGLKIRSDAMREAGLSYGARGGLAFRTFEIQRRLAEYDTSLSKTYNFNRLLIPAASGLLVEPPIVSAAERAVIVKSGGQTAAVADRVFRINHGARIVTASRDWHLYLERDWGRVEPPPDILLPRNAEERAYWADLVQQGWQEGVHQAEETFQSDLDRMTADYLGMIRYRELLAQNMITAPFTLADERGITGGGSEMRIGDRGLSITGQSQLVPEDKKWTPAPR